jgi:hypothetical protein
LEIEDRVVGDLLEVLDHINPTIAELTRAIEQQAEKCPEAQRLMTHPGVGALTALVLVLIVGEAERFGWASRSPAILVWFRRKIPAESAADWDTSARSARVSTLEKNLTAPTLLEMAISRQSSRGVVVRSTYDSGTNSTVRPSAFYPACTDVVLLQQFGWGGA